jgi:hypothetical protein
MSVRLNDGKLVPSRVILAVGLIGAVLFALVLGATPQLHERLHQASSTANHVCAVTLLSSGNYQHTLGAAIAPAPPAPPTAFTHISTRFHFVSAHLQFSLLEHAPPTVS